MFRESNLSYWHRRCEEIIRSSKCGGGVDKLTYHPSGPDVSIGGVKKLPDLRSVEGG